MRHSIHLTGLLALIVILLVAGCGKKATSATEEPAPVPAATAPTPARPISPGGPAPEPIGLSLRATLEQRIGFAFDRSDLGTEARSILSAKAKVLRESQDITLRIEGHADERGSDEYNLALSNRRAAAAKRFLIQQGIAAHRLETVGYGEERPADPAHGEAAWTLNRRAEFRVTGGTVAQR